MPAVQLRIKFSLSLSLLLMHVICAVFQPQPDDFTSTPGGIPVIRPPKPTLTGVVESRDPEEWKFVEALMPSKIVPDPPKHASYPTPSGWVPPKG